MATVAMLVVVRHSEEKLPHGAMLPWVHRRECRGEGRHAVLGLTHELYLLLAEANDNFYLNEQPRLWHLQGPRAFSHGVVQVSHQCASRLRINVDQRSDLAIPRSTPTRLALSSVVALVVAGSDGKLLTRGAAWYAKAHPTFSDALAHVRRQLWRQMGLCLSASPTESRKPAAAIFAHLTDLLCCAA